MNDPEVQYNVISVEYDSTKITARLTLIGDQSSKVWPRLVSRLMNERDVRNINNSVIELPWSTFLGLLLDFGTRSQQTALNFRFNFVGEAQNRIKQFSDEVKQNRTSRTNLVFTYSPQEIQNKLISLGFTKRNLRSFQERDLLHLSSLAHGANFSVPGAGKTTVTLALNLITAVPESHFFIVGPKSSFPAWMDVVKDCIDTSVNTSSAEPFCILDSSEEENERILRSGATRFLMSYDLMVRQQGMISAYFARQPVHLVLDEAHRMKAGLDSQRGAFLMNVAPLLQRRDILTGTPMPQGPNDLASQLNFLWPGQGLDTKIYAGITPREVLGNLYVRTTKSELHLPPVKRHFIDVPMFSGQLALYGIVRNETLRKLSKNLQKGSESINFLGAKRSVIRLLQLSSNPILALKGITEDFTGINSGVIDEVLNEGPSAKIQAVVNKARELASLGKKCVIWTIFTQTINELETLLADLNPVSLYGAVPSGLVTDPDTREGRLSRFHNDSACMVMIANPAAAGEGISLHKVCHDAIYLDRSYVSTHYLQSIDRIHRLGLDEGTETNIFIYRTKAPVQLGSIDYSVSRRLLTKINGLQQLLDDPDLKEVAYDEENADDPNDYSVDLQDLVDLVEELEGKRFAPSEEESD